MKQVMGIGLDCTTGFVCGIAKDQPNPNSKKEWYITSPLDWVMIKPENKGVAKGGRYVDPFLNGMFEYAIKNDKFSVGYGDNENQCVIKVPMGIYSYYYLHTRFDGDIKKAVRDFKKKMLFLTDRFKKHLLDKNGLSYLIFNTSEASTTDIEYTIWDLSLIAQKYNTFLKVIIITDNIMKVSPFINRYKNPKITFEVIENKYASLGPAKAQSNPSEIKKVTDKIEEIIGYKE